MKTQLPSQRKDTAISRQASRSPAQAQFADNRPEIAAQRKLQNAMAASAQTAQLHELQRKMQCTQLAEEEKPLQAQASAAQRKITPAPKPNNTGLPDNLKAGIESLSGMSMDHVKVHYNSSQPAQLNAHAYAQGSDIHVAPGQEQCLPHEAWHVVQQAQGRVKPTMQMKQGVPVNDDEGLEREADVMGAKALQLKAEGVSPQHHNHIKFNGQTVQCWPDMTGNTSGNMQYIISTSFNNKHIAASYPLASTKAKSYYDPWGNKPRNAQVTVIVLNALQQINNVDDRKAEGGYDWTVGIDLAGNNAVCWQPTGRAGINGDPGVALDVSYVVVSGYNTDDGKRLITHVKLSD